VQQVKTPSHHHDRAGGAAASRSFSSVVVDRTGRAGPLILLGMHRSGTSMAARLLERLGVFMGWRKDSNHEADFFRHANEWLLSQAGGAWDHPEPVRTLRRAPLSPATLRRADPLVRLSFSLRGPQRGFLHLVVSRGLFPR